MEEKQAYRSTARFLMISPTKVRPIADNIRMKPYTEAMAILDSLPQRGAGFLKKAIKSAAGKALGELKDLKYGEGVKNTIDAFAAAGGSGRGGSALNMSSLEGLSL